MAFFTTQPQVWCRFCVTYPQTSDGPVQQATRGEQSYKFIQACMLGQWVLVQSYSLTSIGQIQIQHPSTNKQPIGRVDVRRVSPEFDSPSDGRIGRRWFESHRLPVGALNILKMVAILFVILVKLLREQTHWICWGRKRKTDEGEREGERMLS